MNRPKIAPAPKPSETPSQQPPARPKVDKPIQRRREDADFLPAALEILESPPSPNSMAFLVTICALLTFAIAWSYFGRIDIVAVAHGKVQPVGRAKVIQPADRAKVVRIRATNGQKVEAGAVLVEFDDADARADRDLAINGLTTYRGAALRRRATLAAIERGDFSSAGIAWPADMPTHVRDREDAVLRGDLAQLAAGLASLDAQLAQKMAETKRLAEMLAAEKALLDVLEQRANLRAQLVEKGAGPLTSLIDARESLRYHTTTYVTTKGQLAEVGAAMEVLRRDRAKMIESFVAENRQKLVDDERQAEEYRLKVEKALVRIGDLVLKSPIAGTVNASTLVTVGQIVSGGEEIMRVVPSDMQIEVEAYVENKDIGFIHEGQGAVVKVDAFPFTRYGSIEAIVKHVASDAVPDSDAQQALGDPAKSSRSSGFAGVQKTQGLVFPVTLSLNSTTIDADGARVALAAGMAVSVEIRTGDRRIIDYLLSPITETTSRAMRER